MTRSRERARAACAVALACCSLLESGTAHLLQGQENAAAVIAFMDVA
jgi:hypothetical protein